MRKSMMMIDVSGLMGLLVVYFGILSLVDYPNQAIKEFANLWYWTSILIIGFGIRLGLFSYVKVNIYEKSFCVAEVSSVRKIIVHGLLEMPISIMEI
ncbi:MAG: hypothetical protein GXP60_03615 [Epsilonproteobacteria bacterium]|nr:hypothetical protein [Campylobacterota bacterium]